MDALARLATPAAYLAIPVVMLAAITLAVFFLGRGEPWGSVNDFFDALALVLLIPAVIAVQSRLADQAGGWLGVLSTVTVLGLLVAAAGQLLLIVRVIDLNTSYATGGIGIVPFIVWVIALSWLSLGRQLLPETLGWLCIAVLVTSVALTVVASLELQVLTWIASAAFLTSLLAWLYALGGAVGARTAPLPA